MIVRLLSQALTRRYNPLSPITTTDQYMRLGATHYTIYSQSHDGGVTDNEKVGPESL